MPHFSKTCQELIHSPTLTQWKYFIKWKAAFEICECKLVTMRVFWSAVIHDTERYKEHFKNLYHPMISWVVYTQKHDLVDRHTFVGLLSITCCEVSSDPHLRTTIIFVNTSYIWKFAETFFKLVFRYLLCFHNNCSEMNCGSVRQATKSRKLYYFHTILVRCLQDMNECLPSSMLKKCRYVSYIHIIFNACKIVAPLPSSIF